MRARMQSEPYARDIATSQRLTKNFP